MVNEEGVIDLSKPEMMGKLSGLVRELRDIHPRDSGYAELGTRAADELVRLNNLLRSPLSPVELKMVDRHEPNWIAFKHAWNAIMKRRIAEIDRSEVR